jgi:membrane fusion protein
VIVVPPSGSTALLIASAALCLLLAATFIVEVPERSRAVGVLMPKGGFIEMVAGRSGQVTDVFVSQGQVVSKEHLLLSTGNRSFLNGQPVAEELLRSLQSELALQNSAHARRRELARDRLSALAEEMESAIAQRKLAEQRNSSLNGESRILEKRLMRWQELVRDGHVARDAFELEQAKVIRMRAEHAGIRRMTIELSQRTKTIARLQAEARNQLELEALQHAMNAERLRRDIARGQLDAVQEFRAPEQSVVTQVLVQPGDAVQPGQVLLKLRQPGDGLQAWLYLPTSRARLLHAGQVVEIVLDAYPTQVYGTHTAVVTSVSGTAMLPKDIHVPLLLAGPVFEVKADLEQAVVSTASGKWPLTPGISFSAEIIQRRLKLYEWLFKAAGLPGDGSG